MQKKQENEQKEKPLDRSERAKLYTELEKEYEKETPDVWHVLEIRKKLGTYHGDIKVTKIKEYHLTKGPHYYVVENPRRRSIKCISCPISHGGILEAHLLARYRLEKGVLYLDDEPVNQIPDGFKPTIDTE
jgi:hypothetical protein